MKIRHKQDGTPYARLYLGKDESGKVLRPYREFAGMTDAQAARAAEAWAKEQRRELDGKHTPTLYQALTGYVDSMEALGNSHNTTRAYRHYTNAYLQDLAGRSVADVTAKDLDGNFETLLTEGTTGRGLSASTVQTYRAFLQGAWKTFVRDGMAPGNVVRETKRPQAIRHEAQALDDTDVRNLLREVRRDLGSATAEDAAPHGAIRRNVALAVYLALFTGARVGEIAALRVRDVSTRAHRLTICGNVVIKDGQAVRQDKTKGKRSRSVTLDQATNEELQKQIAWLASFLQKVGKATPLLTTDGQHMRPDTLSRGFTTYCKRLDMEEGLTFHSLRHTHATMLLQQGTNARVIQERLGHADVRTTLAIYGHVMPTNDAEAAQAFAQSINM